MPRPPRADEAGAIYHAINRRNARQILFQKDPDYEAFERVICEGLKKHPVDLFAYQWMPNHWHMVLRPRENGAMGRLLYWVTMTHSARYHAHYHSTGHGHLYQGRFKSFPVQDDDHFLVACRYVERNALAAGLVKRAESWRWGSLWNRRQRSPTIRLAPWRLPKPACWIDRVNEDLSDAEKKRFRESLKRSSPFGERGWAEETASRLQLESTLRPRGRPRKFAQIAK